MHFATGFFLAVTGRSYRQEDLNFTVALPARKQPEGNYALLNLREHLVESGRISDSMEPRELHLLRTHLQAVADNDDAVYPMFAKKAGFGSDYSASSSILVGRSKDNDGFLGQFVKSVLERSVDGQAILRFTENWLSSKDATMDELLAPLLEDEAEDVDLSKIAEEKLGRVEPARLDRVSDINAAETAAIRRLCENCSDMPVEFRLRYLIIGLGCWVASYLRRSTLSEGASGMPLLADMTGGGSLRMREQSRWSYTRFRESVIERFVRLAETDAFADCQDAWEWVQSELDGRPKVEEFFRELLIRNGLAQPRGGSVNSKHIELQPDTLAMLTLSVIGQDEGPVPLPEFFERMSADWGLCFGGRPKDADELAAHGYFGLDEKTDLTANVEATTELLINLGLARKYSDGLVLCQTAYSAATS